MGFNLAESVLDLCPGSTHKVPRGNFDRWGNIDTFYIMLSGYIQVYNSELSPHSFSGPGGAFPEMVM